MKQKTLLILAASLTAFLLVVSGAIISQAARPAAAADQSEIYAQREAEYQSRLEEANAALAAVYDQQGSGDQSAQIQPESDGPTAAISPEAAVSVAAAWAPNAALLREPELVLFEGVLAYEISLDNDTMIYVDANTGSFLYASSSQPQVSVQTRHYSDDDDDRWEGHDD